MPPSTIPSIEPMQLIALEMVDRVLKDAGYDEVAGEVEAVLSNIFR